MEFSSPAFLFALPLALAPLILHLFYRRRRSTVLFSSLNFFLRQEKNIQYISLYDPLAMALPHQKDVYQLPLLHILIHEAHEWLHRSAFLHHNCAHAKWLVMIFSFY